MNLKKITTIDYQNTKRIAKNRATTTERHPVKKHPLKASLGRIISSAMTKGLD